MTNEELLQDLKQFITATVSQQTTGLATKEDLVDLATKRDVKDEVIGAEKRLMQHIDNVQDAIAETITKAMEEVDKPDKDHERRITALEHKLA
jgi:hypothetical protein